MSAPIAIGVGGERVFVADLDGDRIHVLTRDGRPLADWGGSGAGPGQLHAPAGLAVARDGSVYVTDLQNHRVQQFGSDGRLMGGWSLGDEAQPFGIAVDGRGRVYVTDLDAARVSVWSAEGAAIATFGSRGSGPGQMIDPWGIAVDSGGDVWVADHGNDRIQRFTAAGEWLGSWGEAGRGEGQILGPMGLAFARDGSLIVTDLVEGRVRSFSTAGAVMARWEAAESGPAPGVAIDAGGDLLLAGLSPARIERIATAPNAAALPTPTAFALMPIAQPMGRGPVTLELACPGPGSVSAEMFSLDGRSVYSVPKTASSAGVQRITWDTRLDDGRLAPTGVYFVRVLFEDGVRRAVQTGRVVVLR